MDAPIVRIQGTATTSVAAMVESIVGCTWSLRVLAAIREDRFYILAEDAWRNACNTRLDEILHARNPSLEMLVV